ncbi:thiamine pyrophosphate-dependent dehydrogenase E1 component subunit alpha [Actinomycetospora endophytica]|uniref:Thiamine pyrophosphate-dependent dehydrogenase E1 component subunit alpha n=1 Tax=Actinomycetospora endophytica TaxID=2291215 RepID=A0ABS8P5S7_9PSEU|nr:thiamine pyrophosphate-dependent dehydrogenase E1 component subunit alpha [Actinomycetospora endophytica]MCD2192905.1 thiamine pyrophosphate-dependent dehydrogenase E1 component subunit alpha [Actinomycetospora endophytica]
MDAPVATPPRAEQTAPDLRDLYERMLRIRQFEAKVDVLYRQGRVRGPAHLGLGQEAIAVGVAAALRSGDFSLGTYRGHAHALARGASEEAVLRELLGRVGGICGGKGGSMHITSVEHGYYGSYAIVGGHIPTAVGMAWASRIRRDGGVTACFFGDGTTNIGAFHEAVNLAAVWSLPVVFVCENNLYMEYTPIGDVIPVERPAADRASAYGLAPLVVDGNDVAAVREMALAAVDRARRGDGPSLVEAVTYRLGGHSVADGGAYRHPDEVAAARTRDPLVRLATEMAQSGEMGVDESDALVTRVKGEMDALAARVLEEPTPDAAGAWTGMWSDGSAAWRN